MSSQANVEQEKLKRLLSEAIPLLCKNGISFEKEFAIEALVGITVDQDRVVLVRVNETVKTPHVVLNKLRAVSPEKSTDVTDNVETQVRRRRKRLMPVYRPSASKMARIDSPALNTEEENIHEVIPENAPETLPLFTSDAIPDCGTELPNNTAIKIEPCENHEDVFVEPEPLMVKEEDDIFVDEKDSLNSIYHQESSQSGSLHLPTIPQPFIASDTSPAVEEKTLAQPSSKENLIPSMKLDKPYKRPSWFRGVPLQEDVHFKIIYLNSDSQTDPQPRHLCLICNQRRTIRQDAIKEHIVACHFGQALFICKDCNRRFKHSSSLAAHRRRCLIRNWPASPHPNIP